MKALIFVLLSSSWTITNSFTFLWAIHGFLKNVQPKQTIKMNQIF